MTFVVWYNHSAVSKCWLLCVSPGCRGRKAALPTTSRWSDSYCSFTSGIDLLLRLRGSHGESSPGTICAGMWMSQSRLRNIVEELCQTMWGRKKSKAWQPSVQGLPLVLCPSPSIPSSFALGNMSLLYFWGLWSLYTSHSSTKGSIATCIQCPLYCSPHTCAWVAKRGLLGPKREEKGPLGGEGFTES